MMKCPECGAETLRTTHSYSAGEAGITRSRKCDTCLVRFTTVEVVLSRGLSRARSDGYAGAAKLLREGRLELRRVDTSR